MLWRRLSCLRAAPLSGLRSVFSKSSPALRTNLKSSPLQQQQQAFSTKSRFGFRRVRSAKETLKDAAFGPAPRTAFIIDHTGRLIVAGGATVGLGALCYYGLGMSNEIGAIEKSAIWPQYVKDRIHSTYMYCCGSLGLTALSAVAVSRSPALLGLMMRGSWLAFGATFAAVVGTFVLVMSIDYEHSPVPKHLAWMLNTGLIGATLAPVILLGGPLMIRAAWYTAGVVGGLSTVAMCAPSEKFLYMGGPLAAGLGVVFASSIGSIFLPSTSALGAGLYAVSVYGGLVLFSLFLLYDTQNVIKRAETHPMYSVKKYDPINSCLAIYIDTLSIFIRLVMILANGGGNRKK